jgi:hypothetical protein
MSTDDESKSIWSRVGDQLGYGVIRDYLVPVETNNVWYSLGGILGIAIVLQFIF